MKRINKAAEIRKVIRDDLEKIVAASTASITFVCPDCQRVTVDMADVKALEADNTQLRLAVERLTSAGLSTAQGEVAKEDELDYWIRSWTEKDAKNATLADEARQSHEYIERLEAKLYDIVGSKRDFDELLKMVKAER